MLRLLTLILLFALYSPSVGVASCSLECDKGAVSASSISSDDLTFIGPKSSEAGYEMLQGQILVRVVSQRVVLENSGGAGLQSAVRQHRLHSNSRALSAAIPYCHAGRITKIFEYDYYRSALRVVYYLHTLCRLRI